MRFDGHLGTWHHDRGFGFITPTQGGQDIFVRDSDLPHGPNRPLVGDALSFEIALDDRGRKHAVRVLRAAPPPRRSRPAPLDERATRRRQPGRGLRCAMPLLLIALAGWGYVELSRWTADRSDGTVSASPAPDAPAPDSLPAPPPSPAPRPLAADAPAPAAFRCDGRQHCTQMHSCAEATFFLRNCPDTKMDGDHDGIPCEDQLCSDGSGGSGGSGRRHR